MIRSGREQGDTSHSLIMFCFWIWVLALWACSLTWKLWDFGWCTFLENWVWFEYFSCIWILKVGHGDPQNLLRSVCSRCPSTLLPVPVLGESKSKNPWSLRKGHSIIPFSHPQLGRCLESAMGSPLGCMCSSSEGGKRYWEAFVSHFLTSTQEKGYYSILCPGEYPAARSLLLSWQEEWGERGLQKESCSTPYN